jgi:general secretion pathway protein J
MKHARGFTLIEVMVAVGLVVMMSTIIFMALRVNFRARKSAYRVQTSYHQASVALNRMRRALSMAFLSEHTDLEKNRETIFDGDSDRVLFTYLGHMRMEPESRESDQGVIEFYTRRDKETGEPALFMREKGVIDDDLDSGGRVLKLAERVKKLRLEYYNDEQEDWESDWKAEMPEDAGPAGSREAEALKKSVEKLTGAEDMETFILPKAVRITLVIEDEEEHEYPFVTAVQLNMIKAFDW